MSWRSLIDWALSPIFDFAEERFRDDEAHRSIMLGGCSLADELRCHASGPNPDHTESRVFHVRKDAA